MSILDNIEETIERENNVKELPYDVVKTVRLILQKNLNGWKFADKTTEIGKAYSTIVFNKNIEEVKSIAEPMIYNIKENIQKAIQELEQIGFEIKMSNEDGVELISFGGTPVRNFRDTYFEIRKIEDYFNGDLKAIKKYQGLIDVLEGNPEALAKKEKYEKDAESMAKFYHGKKYAD